MRIEQDTTGRLFVDEAGVATLRDWLEDGDAAAGERLTGIGMLTAGALHPALEPVAEALTEPFCHLIVSVAGAGGVAVHRAWAAPGVLVVFAQLRDDEYEVLTSPPEFTTAGIARLIRLGVRPRLAPDTCGLDIEALGGLFGVEAGMRAGAARHLADAAPASWDAWATELRNELWRAWRLDVLWVGPDGSQVGRQLTAVDTNGGIAEAGWSVSTGARLVPTTPTALWGKLVAILPTDDELLPADAPGQRARLS